MAAFSLVPRDKEFFKEFVSLGNDVRNGARALKQMIATEPPDIAKGEEIHEIEHACDRCTRGIIDRLNRTFVTPLDREDIHALAISLDDVMDAIDATAALIRANLDKSPMYSGVSWRCTQSDKRNFMLSRR